MRNFAALLIGFVICAQSWAQITVAPVTPQGRKIPAFFATEAPKEAKVKFVYETSKNADFVDLGGGHIVLIGTNGEGSTIHGIAIWVVDGEPFLQQDTKPFRVGDSPGPEPTPVTLRELVTAEQAKQIAIYFRDFAGLVATLKSPAQFWTAFDSTFPIKGNEQLDAALRKRLEGPVEAKKGLSTVLLAIAAEFDTQPVPPTPDQPVPDTKPGLVRVTYVYEKDDSPVPSEIHAGINRLKREKKVLASLFEEDTTDADGDVPDQYKVALSEARAAGLPALVAEYADKSRKVLVNPKTEAQVWSLAP